MRTEPIMTVILNNLDATGALPRGFRLPDSSLSEDTAPEMRFLDGAEDGVRLYHMKAKPVDLMPYTSVLYEIKNGAFSKASRHLSRAIRDSKKQFVHMIDIVGPLQEWMGKHPNVMHDEAFLRFAVQEMMTETDRDHIKFALALVSNYTLEEKGQIQKMVRVLSLSDEFTFQCVTMMKDWKNGMEEVFEVAKRVQGWGRIHAVHYLEPETAAIRHWMLTDGWKNDVRTAYSARDLAVKLPLVKLLTDPNLPADEFDGISGIMDGLLDESPVPGISSLNEKDILMDLYLKAAEGKVLTREGVSAVTRIRGLKA